MTDDDDDYDDNDDDLMIDISNSVLLVGNMTTNQQVVFRSRVLNRVFVL
jgi:hypothetical protein